MNRFFSKLDLRDIKIDPAGGSRFPPDADESVDEKPEAAPEAQPVETHEHVASETVAWTPPRQTEYQAQAFEPRSPARPTPAPNAPAMADEFAAPAKVRPRDLEPDDTITSDLAFVPESEGEVLKVSARSRPSAVAGAIAGVVREVGRAEVQAIGAGATNQAIKAVAIAREYLRETDIDVVCVPAFIDVTIENEERTAMRLIVEPR